MIRLIGALALILGLASRAAAGGQGPSPAPAADATPVELDSGCSTSPYRPLLVRLPGGERQLRVKPEQNPLLGGVAIEADFSMGSSFGATSVRLRDTRNGQTIEASFDVDFARMLNRHPVPEELRGEDREDWRRMLERAAFSTVCVEPDPSLSRLLDPVSPLSWRPGRPEMPESYVLRRVNPITRTPEWLEYLGFNHRRLTNDSIREDFELVAQQGSLQLLRSGHGALVRDTERQAYAWIYVSPGGHKLRWPSVTGGRLERGMAVLELARVPGEPGDTRVTIDLESGRPVD